MEKKQFVTPTLSSSKYFEKDNNNDDYGYPGGDLAGGFNANRFVF